MNLFNKGERISRFGLKALLIITGSFWVLIANAADDLCEPATGNIARAMFTTAIENREPVDRVLILENNISDIYFFSDLRHFQGKTLKHRWEYEGRVVNEKTFEVKGPRWRVYSVHKIDRNMLGRWTVVMTDDKDCPLKAVIFQYVSAGEGNGSAIIKLQ